MEGAIYGSVLGDIMLIAMNKVSGWPLAYISRSFNEQTYDWRETLATVVAEFVEKPVFDFGIFPDKYNSSINKFYVSVKY